MRKAHKIDLVLVRSLLVNLSGRSIQTIVGRIFLFNSKAFKYTHFSVLV